LTCNDFNGEHSEGGFQSNHEHAAAIEEHISAVEDVLPEDVAEV